MTRRVSTPLHEACQNINSTPLSTFQCLIEEQGLDINTLDQHSSSPAHYAFKLFQSGTDIDILRYLINQPNININQLDSNGYTVLHYACQHHHLIPLDVFKTILDELTADPTLQTTDLRYTPLHVLFTNLDNGYDLPTFEYLCSHPRVNINQEDESGKTPLYYLCNQRCSLPHPLSLLKCVLENGADVDMDANDDDDTPLHLFLRSCQTDNDIGMIKDLLSQPGIGVNKQNHNGDTQLHDFCLGFDYLSFRKVQCLVELGANFNIQNENQNTPLHYAFACMDDDDYDIETLSYLCSQPGIDFGIKDKWGKTCIESAFDQDCDGRRDIRELVKCIVDNDLLKYSSVPKEEHIQYCLRYIANGDDTEIDCVIYICEHTAIDFSYRGDHGRSLLHDFTLVLHQNNRNYNDYDLSYDNSASQLTQCLIDQYITQVLE